MGKKRPGVMFYFEWLYILEELTTAEQGELLMAALVYAQTGKKPNYADRAMRIAWRSMQTHVDADEERYDQRVQQTAEAASRRWEGKKKQSAPLTRDAEDQSAYHDEVDRIIMEQEMRAQRKNANA